MATKHYCDICGKDITLDERYRTEFAQWSNYEWYRVVIDGRGRFALCKYCFTYFSELVKNSQER